MTQSSNPAKVSLTFAEMADLTMGISSISAKLVSKQLGTLFSSAPSSAPSSGPKLEPAYLAKREFGSRFSVRQLQYLLPDTETSFRNWCKLKTSGIAGGVATIEYLNNGAKALWFGQRPEVGWKGKLVWLLHGGGHVLPAHPGHFNFVKSLMEKARAEGVVDVKGVMLGFDLAPHSVFPTQLRQAVTLLHHLFSISIQPSQILLCGESAGANLILSLLLHLLHPRTDIPTNPLPTPFLGAILVSPWATFSVSSATMKSNDTGLDCLTPKTLASWGQTYLGPDRQIGSDCYAEPLQAEEGWWRGMGRVVGNVCVTAGKKELMFSDQEEVVRLLRLAEEIRVEWLPVDEIHSTPVHCLEKEGITRSVVLDQVLAWASGVLAEK